MNALHPTSTAPDESERLPSLVTPLIGFVLTTALTSAVMLLLSQI